jgi:hypothetical protein
VRWSVLLGSAAMRRSAVSPELRNSPTEAEHGN